MDPADVPTAEAAWDHTYRTLLIEKHLPTQERSPELVELRQRRMLHLLETDPEGSWIAADGETVIGVAQAHVRGDRWILATLGVLPEFQERGIGRQLLALTLDYRGPAPLGAIFSSPDPRALHRYASAGFDLHPTVGGFGPPRKGCEEPSGIDLVSEGALDTVAAVDRSVRGTERTGDIDFHLRNGYQLLLAGTQGYAIITGGILSMLAAVDEDTAEALLRAAIARCPRGESFNVSWVTARQQWAIRVLVAAGVPLFVHEAVMTLGRWEPDRPYLANGIFG